MSNFVLVHGAWQGAWSWDRVVDRMEAAREFHDLGKILALDLPGHGQHFVSDIRRVTMDHYVHAVATPVQVERLLEVVLVGLGFAATFLPRVALELGDRIKRVVFVAGELPPEGKSAHDRMSLWDKSMLKVFKAEEKGFRFPNFKFKGLLCNGLDRTSSRILLSRLSPEPFLPLVTSVTRQGFVGSFPTTYVLLSRDKVVPPKLQRRYVQSLGSPQLLELDAGHGAFFSHSQEIADILLKCA